MSGIQNERSALIKQDIFISTKNLLNRKDLFEKICLHAVLILVGIVMLIPFLWMVSASFKSEVEIFKFPISWIPKNIVMYNYSAIFLNEKYNFMIFYLNSFKVASVVTLVQLVTCSMAAYAFAKIEFPGRDKIFLCYLSTLMVPFQVIMIPLFIIMSFLNLNNTHMSLILMYSFSAIGVFMLRQFYMSIPIELSEAARIDGCSNFSIYRMIILPNVKPALASLAVFQFLWMWNDFLAPLVFLNTKSNMTIPLGLKTFVSEYNIEYGKIMAGTTLSILPIILIYFLAQRYFIEGIALSGLKG